MISSHVEGRTGSGQSDRKCRCDWTFVLRGFPQVEDLTQDEVDDSDVMGDK